MRESESCKPQSTKSKDESFPEEEKIKRRKDFERIFKIGKRVQGKKLTLIVNRESLIVNQERKVGIVISRRVKGSVVRNKLKRRLRDIYRRNKDNFKGEYIILAYPGAQLMSYSELREEVLRLGRQM